MGIIPPFEAGNDCLLCFGAGETPRRVYASASGIQVGGAWNPGDGAPLNGTFELEQVIGDACWWLHDPFPISVDISRGILGSGCGMNYFAPFRWVFRKQGTPCQNFFTNQFAVPGGNKFYGGVVQIWTL